MFYNKHNLIYGEPKMTPREQLIATLDELTEAQIEVMLSYAQALQSPELPAEYDPDNDPAIGFLNDDYDEANDPTIGFISGPTDVSERTKDILTKR